MNNQTAMWALVLFGSAAAAHGQTPGTIFQATLGESGQRTAEVSTRGAQRHSCRQERRRFRRASLSRVRHQSHSWRRERGRQARRSYVGLRI